ncbi:hypothetical protein ISCGN_001744 [Ixodes scapularis]
MTRTLNAYAGSSEELLKDLARKYLPTGVVYSSPSYDGTPNQELDKDIQLYELREAIADTKAATDATSSDSQSSLRFTVTMGFNACPADLPRTCGLVPDDFKVAMIRTYSPAQRRRQRKLNDEVGPTAVPKPPTPLPVRKAAPRPNPLPRDDFKLVLRPQDGLKLANLDIAEVSLALLNSINFTWRQANLRVRVDATQNTATISTPSSDAAKALGNLKQLKIGNTIHMVTLYGLAPDDSSKGLVRGVPLRFSDAEILANSDQSQFEIYTCRRLGQSKMVILTFAGLKVPFFVTLFGGEYPVSLYKKTIPACTVCHEAGHRSTACPQPKVNVCHQCGLKDPHEGHTCEPLCTLCDGPHLTAARGCPKRFSESKSASRSREPRPGESNNKQCDNNPDMSPPFPSPTPKQWETLLSSSLPQDQLLLVERADRARTAHGYLN